MNTKKVILVVGIVIVALVLMGVIYRGREGFIPGFGTSGAPPVGKFVMYYADWCPHCKAVKPDFEDFAKAGIVTVNGRNVVVEMVEESEKEKMKGVDVKGFPSFMFYSTTGTSVEYNGPRTRDSWMDFLAEQTGK